MRKARKESGSAEKIESTLRLVRAFCVRKKPVLQDSQVGRIQFAEGDSHTQMNVGINDSGRSFEAVRLGENLDVNRSAAWKRIDGVQVASVEAEVAHSNGKERAGVFVQHFSGGNEGESWCAASLFFHDATP